MPCVYLPGPAPAVTVAKTWFANCVLLLQCNIFKVACPPMVLCPTMHKKNQICFELERKS